MPKKYKISAIRYADDNYEKEIDKILISSNLTYREAMNSMEAFMRNNTGFTDAFIDHFVKSDKKIKTKESLVCRSVLTKNSHGYLGPGGYIMESEAG